MVEIEISPVTDPAHPAHIEFDSCYQWWKDFITERIELHASERKLRWSSFLQKEYGYRLARNGRIQFEDDCKAVEFALKYIK